MSTAADTTHTLGTPPVLPSSSSPRSAATHTHVQSIHFEVTIVPAEHNYEWTWVHSNVNVIVIPPLPPNKKNTQTHTH